jgi:3-hydroxyisobutyrate dehydrogenase-like beta-hydroxyacid dehydrogenase
MSKVAVVGVGAMGEPIARNLLRKGFAVTLVRHRRPEPVARLQAEGARVVDTPAAAAAGHEVVVLSLPTSKEVEAVVLGPNGLLAAAAPGTVIVDCSTSDPASTDRLASLLNEKAIGLVAAGMTRGVAGAREGRLAFFIGGDNRDVAKAKQVLGAAGDTFIEFGSAADAHTAKLLSNVLSYSTVALINEVFMLAQRSGLDLETFCQAVSEGAPSKALESFGPRILAGAYDPPRAPVRQACTDMDVMHALASRTTAPTFLLSAAQQAFRLASSRGHAARDLSAIAELWRAEERGKSS